MPGLDLFNTYYMAGLVENSPRPRKFFLDRYFSESETFTTDKVLFEHEEGDLNIVPFIAASVGDIPVDRNGYSVYEFAPPLIAPSRLITLDDLSKRGFGEAIFGGSTPAERAKKLHQKDLVNLSDRITRREELMAVETMINNGVDVQEYIDEKTVGKVIPIRYYDTAAGNPGIYTVSGVWTGYDAMCADIEAMCDSLAENDQPATDLVIGTDVWATMRQFAELKEILDNRRIDMGFVKPEEVAPGVTKVAELNFGGYVLSVFVPKEKYRDASGNIQNVFPTKSVLVTAPNCGKRYYGAVTQIPYGSSIQETVEGERIPKLVVDQNKDIRKLRVASRPLTAPKTASPWRYAANVVN
ncbi:MAG: major capsid protein [Clostridia bacterium]|nr:major capsid protein [Clostridia bacterium]